MDLKLAAMPELQELDLIVGGHTHTFLYTDDPPELQVWCRSLRLFRFKL